MTFLFLPIGCWLENSEIDAALDHIDEVVDTATSETINASDLNHGDLVVTEAGILKCRKTPGHASNHLCFLLAGPDMLFSGDHIMQGSTVVINPPDGDKKAYLESIYDLLGESDRIIAPPQGFPMAHPEAVINYMLAPRLAREHKALQALSDQEAR